MKTVGFRVNGRVQGVGYRAWTARNATRLGLVGFVRNLQDGSVEGVLQGDDAAVDALVEAMQRGPTHAVVRGLRTVALDALGAQGFEVRATLSEPEVPVNR